MEISVRFNIFTYHLPFFVSLRECTLSRLFPFCPFLLLFDSFLTIWRLTQNCPLVAILPDTHSNWKSSPMDNFYAWTMIFLHSSDLLGSCLLSNIPVKKNHYNQASCETHKQNKVRYLLH